MTKEIIYSSLFWRRFRAIFSVASTLIFMGFLLMAIESNGKENYCNPGTSKGCSDGSICMRVYPSGKECRKIEPVLSLNLILPFDSTTRTICTVSGVHNGTHSWANAFWAIDLA